jgi:hypothetical protein
MQADGSTADSGGSQFFGKAEGNDGGAARVSYAGNLAKRQLSDFLSDRTRPNPGMNEP